MRIAFDMETRDPDDALTLCLLATHPAVELAAVTVNPGARAQLGVVREILGRLGAADVPVGSRDPASTADALSSFHHEWLGDPGPAEPDGAAHDVLAAAVSAPGTVLVCGAPLHNVRDLLLRHAEAIVDRAVLQGGFAGDNLVAVEDRLLGFAGRTATESHNFGANKRATLVVLDDPRVRTRDLVSKNVTHGVVWDAALQRRLRETDGLTGGMRLACEAMDVYLRSRPDGKALHDPLAACAAIRPEVCRWAQVKVSYSGGRWGAEAAADSSTSITIGVDQAAFLRTLVEPAEWL